MMAGIKKIETTLTHHKTAVIIAAILVPMTLPLVFLGGVFTVWMPVVALILAWSIKLQIQSAIAACSALTEPAAQLRTALAGITRIIFLNAVPVATAAAMTAWLIDAGHVQWAGLQSQSIDQIAGLYPSGIIPIVPAEREVTDPPSMIVIAVGQLGLCLMLALLLVARRQIWEILHRLLAAYAVKSGLANKIPAAEAGSLSTLLFTNAACIAPVLWYIPNAMCLWRNDAPALSPLTAGVMAGIEMVGALSTLFAWTLMMAVRARVYYYRPSFPPK